MTAGSKFSVALVGIAQGIYPTALAYFDYFDLTIQTAPNLAPVASNDVYATTAATPLNLAAPGVLSNDADPESTPLTATLDSAPSHSASFTLNPNGAFAYTPANGFSGIDWFAYRASDATNASAIAYVDLVVGADTPTGQVVNVQLDGDHYGAKIISLTFPTVTGAGSTSITPIDPASVGTVPGSFTMFGNFAFDIATTAATTGSIDLCFTLSNLVNSNLFSALRILHNESGILVDRTLSADFPSQTICARVPSLSPFALAVYQAQPHDLTVTAISAPKKLTLKTGTVPKPSKVTVAIQNLGTTTEIITNAAMLAELVHLNVESLGSCSNVVATPVVPNKFPIKLGPKKKLTLAYQVTFECANDPLAGIGHEDYRFTAEVDGTALRGYADTNSDNDVCPRAANGTDKGCNKGLAVKTDILVK